jgi:hypothetical protein
MRPKRWVWSLRSFHIRDCWIGPSNWQRTKQRSSRTSHAGSQGDLRGRRCRDHRPHTGCRADCRHQCCHAYRRPGSALSVSRRTKTTAGPPANLRSSRFRSVDAINTFGVSAGRFAYFRVVSHRRFSCFRSSARFLRLVRFPAAPPGKAGQGQKPWPAFFFINISSTSTSTSRLTSRLRKVINAIAVRLPRALSCSSVCESAEVTT